MIDSAPPARSAFEDLYGEVAPAVYAWARLRLRAPLRARLDPEDLLQEVCFRAWRRFADFDAARGSFRAWVFGIAHRVLQEALRELARGASGSPQSVVSHAVRDLPATTTAVSRRVVRNEELRAFLDRVERLEEDDRKLLLLRGIEGLPHADVGRMLGVSSEAAAKRWQRLVGTLADAPRLRVLAAT